MVTSPCIDPAVLAGPPGFHTGNPTPIKSPHGHRLQAGYERWKASTLTHLVDDGALGGLPPPVQGLWTPGDPDYIPLNPIRSSTKNTNRSLPFQGHYRSSTVAQSEP